MSSFALPAMSASVGVAIRPLAPNLRTISGSRCETFGNQLRAVLSGSQAGVKTPNSLGAASASGRANQPVQDADDRDDLREILLDVAELLDCDRLGHQRHQPEKGLGLGGRARCDLMRHVHHR